MIIKSLFKKAIEISLQKGLKRLKFMLMLRLIITGIVLIVTFLIVKKADSYTNQLLKTK